MLINKKSKATVVAFGGIFTALCVVLLYLSAVFTVIDAIFWILASIVIGICIKECGIRLSWCVFVSSAILGFIIVPNIFANIFYASFFGLIPIVYNYIDKKTGRLKIPAVIVLDILYTVVSYLLLSRFYPSFFDGVKAPVIILFVFFAVYYPAYNRMFGNIYFLIKRALNKNKY